MRNSILLDDHLPILLQTTLFHGLSLAELRMTMECFQPAARAGADTFTIPFSRAGLADYLNCERSALSREISRMRDEGLIETYKNSFKLLNKAELTRQYHC